jgi:enoyl-CoA hydratase/carnithine racemase
MSAVPQAEQPVLLREDRDGIATLTLNRPQQMNLLTSEMLTALQGAFDQIAKDPSVRVVVLAATGKGFCAGHDLKEIRALQELPKIEKLFAQCGRMMATIPKLPQPVIAKVQGAAAAAGCQLVAQCDLAIAVDTAKFVTSGVTWGFFCSTPGVAVGRSRRCNGASSTRWCRRISSTRRPRSSRRSSRPSRPPRWRRASAAFTSRWT